VGKVHLGVVDLSAYADGELEPGEAREARVHLDACGRCSADLAALTRLDHALIAVPPVTCVGSVDLRSALLDGQLTTAEMAIARDHIAGCRVCGADEIAWLASEQALRMLPVAVPSARVDAAMRRLIESGARRPLVPGIARLVPGAGLRVGLAATLVLAIVIGLVPTGPGQEQAQAPGESAVLVSGVQQVVLYSPTNTFYVLQPQQAAVNAVDAATYALRAHIAVGGRPTALAIDPVASRILVLDSFRRSLIEIDPAKNTVVGSTPVGVTGTPTSVRVDSANGKVIVTAAREPGPAGPRTGPRPTPDSTAGEVAVLDSTTKKLEVVRSVEVAPRLVITDPQRKGALLVSTTATTLVDSSYQPQRSLPGGVAAAYGESGWIAVLGQSGTDAVLHLFGDGAPQPLRLTGIPLAVTSMPEGGFAVLLGSGSGNGRIVVIDGAGAPVGTTPVDQVGRDLTYDPRAKRFAILSGAGVVAAALPSGIALPEPSAAPSAPTAALPVVPILPQPSASAAPNASPPPSPSPAGSAPVAVQPSGSPPAVPPNAVRISDGLYRLSMGDSRLPILTTASATRVWFLDQANGLNALNVFSGEIHRVAQLPAQAGIRALAADELHAFALDIAGAQVFILDLQTERLTAEPFPAFNAATALAVAGDGRAWIASGRSPELFSLDPTTKRFQIVEVGMQVQILVADGNRGIWFSDGEKTVGFYDVRTSRATSMVLPSVGSARSLLPDPSGTLWVGTSVGEVLSVRDRVATPIASLGRPISSLAADPAGRPWYVTYGTSGFRFGQVAADNSIALPGPAISASFSPASRAWLADPAGGFYLVVGSAR